MPTIKHQLTPEQMQAIWDGAERSGVPDPQPIEEELVRKGEQLRTRIFWIAVDMERITQRLGMDDTSICDLVNKIGKVGKYANK